jgi:hypothetical protein
MNNMKMTPQESEAGSEGAMNAIIIYDKCDLAVEVNAKLQPAENPAGAASSWRVKFWQVDQLLSATGTGLALQDAAEAHLIVLAVRGAAFMPSRFLDWLEQWIKCRAVDCATLAMFGGGGSGGAFSVPTARSLSRFADHHGLSFISAVPALPKPHRQHSQTTGMNALPEPDVV